MRAREAILIKETIRSHGGRTFPAASMAPAKAQRLERAVARDHRDSEGTAVDKQKSGIP